MLGASWGSSIFPTPDTPPSPKEESLAGVKWSQKMTPFPLSEQRSHWNFPVAQQRLPRAQGADSLSSREGTTLGPVRRKELRGERKGGQHPREISVTQYLAEFLVRSLLLWGFVG